MGNSTLHLKQYFTVEKSVFSILKSWKSRFTSGKEGFLRKIQDLTSKMKFSSWKIVLYK